MACGFMRQKWNWHNLRQKYFFYCCLDKGVKGIDVNRVCNSSRDRFTWNHMFSLFNSFYLRALKSFYSAKIINEMLRIMAANI